MQSHRKHFNTNHSSKPPSPVTGGTQSTKQTVSEKEPIPTVSLNIQNNSREDVFRSCKREAQSYMWRQDPQNISWFLNRNRQSRKHTGCCASDLKDHSCRPGLLCQAKWHSWRRKKNFQDTCRLKEFMTTKSALLRTLKWILHTEWKINISKRLRKRTIVKQMSIRKMQNTTKSIKWHKLIHIFQ